MTDTNVTEKNPSEGTASSLRKGKREKKNRGQAWRPEGPRDPFTMLNALPEEKQQEIQKALHLFSLGQSLPKTLHEAKRRTYNFWGSQPVPKLGVMVTSNGPIEEGRAEVRSEPYSLPQGFSWDILDLTNSNVLKELCTFLNDNYTEEDDNTLRLDFSPEYLQWLLMPPGWMAQWYCGLRASSSQKLVGFIAAVPSDLCIYDVERRMVRVHLMCVHKKLRLKRMSPVLIREINRRVSLQGLSQAVYTTGVVVPTPVATCRQWLRSLNPRKMMDVSYPGVRQDMTLQRALKFYRLPETTKTPGLRPMTKQDVPGVHSLLRQHLPKFQLSPVFSAEEVEHWLMPREKVVYTYVVEGGGGALSAVVSFFGVRSVVLNHLVHKHLGAAHCFYCVTNTADLAELMEDALVLAKANGFDVFIALDGMENRCFLEKLKFNPSGKNVHYYLYNWACPTVLPEKVGLVLPC